MIYRLRVLASAALIGLVGWLLGRWTARAAVGPAAVDDDCGCSD